MKFKSWGAAYIRVWLILEVLRYFLTSGSYSRGVGHVGKAVFVKVALVTAERLHDRHDTRRGEGTDREVF